ncbi:MAG: TonB-dependent receptor [Bacteroidota bacterium]
MKLKIIQQLLTMSKFIIYGILIQAFCYSLLLAANGNAQGSLDQIEVKVSKTASDLGSIIEEIEGQTEFEFSYNDAKVNLEEAIALKDNQSSLYNILREISKETNLRFKRIDENIYISDKLHPKEKRVEEIIYDTENQVRLTGIVTSSEDGEALPGVSILIKGTSVGTTTDLNGKYSIQVSQNAILQFSYIGYETQEVEVGNRSTLDVTLTVDLSQLEEVVIVGYGTQAKRDLTGSMSSIKEEKIKDMPLTSIDQGLQGLASGVQIQQQSGQPGGATSIRIRGGNSINAGNEPLYVIDGFPIYNENTSATSGALSGIPPENALASINPNDIVSIEVLKDASATAIYGARAANGVIIVTTKRGKAGESNIDFDMYYGWQRALNLYEMMDAGEYAQFRNDEYDRRGQPRTYTDEQIEEFRRTGGTDWQDEIFRTAPIQNYQLSVSGGNDKVQHMFSGNYFEQQGIIINSFLKRVSGRANIDAQAANNLNFGLSMTASHTWSNQQPTGGGRNGRTGVQQPTSGNIYQNALFYNPTIPVFDEDGNYTLNNTFQVGEFPGANHSNVPYGNPVAYANLAENKNFSTRLLANMYGEWEIIEGLKLRSTIGTNLVFTKQNRFEPSTVWNGQRAPNGRANVGTIQNVEWLNENTISYNKDFNDRHNLNLLGGFTAQAFKNESLDGNNVNFLNDITGYDALQAGNADGLRVPGLFSGANEWQLMSWLGRAFYSFDDKYLFTLTGRYDGSSRFGTNNKWAFFPSAAFAWRVSDENFLASSSLISDLKLRVSWGQSGNQNIPTFRSLATMGSGGYTIGDELPTTFFPNRLGNPDLKWETTTQTNIGFDLGIIQNRVEVTFDAYYKKTTDLLFDVPVPVETGFNSQFANVGSLENKGIELAINGTVLTGEFKWNVNFNWALNRNKVLELQGEERIPIDPRLNLLKAQNSLLLEVGQPIGNFYGYQVDGIFQSAEDIERTATYTSPTPFPGRERVLDQNGDSTINNSDRVIIGNALPQWVGGITNNFAYKNFELNILFDYSYGNDVANLTQIEFEFLNGRQNGNKTILDRWQPDDISLPREEWTNSTNPNTSIPALGNGTTNRQVTSRMVEDGSFLRLRNVTLAYNLPLAKLGIDWMRRCRFFVSGQNLLLFTGYSGLDPEANVYVNDNVRLGLDYAVYPTARTYTFGVNVGF